MPAKIFLATYTIQEEWTADPIASLEKISAMGYEGVEFGLDFPDALLEQIGRKLKQLNLAAVSTHIRLDDALKNAERYLGWMNKLDMGCLCVPWLDEVQLPGGPDYPQTKADLERLNGLCRERGISLFYHNHNFEFLKVNGICKEDLLLQDIPALHAELDVCWCTVAGQSPADYISHYGHRMEIIHLKDYTATGDCSNMKLFDLLGQNDEAEGEAGRQDSGFAFRPVGYGKVDFPSIFQAADAAGIRWMGVEQDASPDRPPIEAAKASLDYIRKQYC